MTNADRVLRYLNEHAHLWLDDDELGARLDIDRHQVNQLCRRLESQGEIRRERIDGKLRNTALGARLEAVASAGETSSLPPPIEEPEAHQAKRLPYDAYHDYYAATKGNRCFLIAVPKGEAVETDIDFDTLEAISMSKALELDMTFVRGWNTKTRRAIDRAINPRPKRNHDVLNMMLAYNARLLSGAVGRFFISK